MLLKTLKIGNLSIQVPIIQGGMGVGISLSGLASAVANEGGVGVISAAGLGVIYKNLSKNYLEASILGLKEELSKARQKTQGVIGVNIMVALCRSGQDGDCRESRYYFCRRGNAAEFTLLSAKRQYH
mgnify:CR=1 FL=1